LGRSLTNQELPETRTLLYQLMVFWSMRIVDGNTDVNGGNHVEVRCTSFLISEHF
jgi:hypothetical protein